jgi:hypothetical protein
MSGLHRVVEQAAHVCPHEEASGRDGLALVLIGLARRSAGCMHVS